MGSRIALIPRASSPTRFVRSWLGSKRFTKHRSPLLIWTRLLRSGNDNDLSDAVSGNSCLEMPRHFEQTLQHGNRDAGPASENGLRKSDRLVKFEPPALKARFTFQASLMYD